MIAIACGDRVPNISRQPGKPMCLLSIASQLVRSPQSRRLCPDTAVQIAQPSPIRTLDGT